jgi:hypothetical protein
MRGNRIVIPKSRQKRVLKLAHATHVVIVRTKQNHRQKNFWIGMDLDIEHKFYTQLRGVYVLLLGH